MPHYILRKRGEAGTREMTTEGTTIISCSSDLMPLVKGLNVQWAVEILRLQGWKRKRDD